MAKLTKKEKAWLGKVQKVLKECPSKRIGFYTIGDNSVHAFDCTMMDEIGECMDRNEATDFGPAAIKVDADFDEYLWFPNPVESTAG